MPGGGTNLELALHCLHEAQGDVQVRRRHGVAEWVGWLGVARGELGLRAGCTGFSNE